jgi:DNA-binding transcriptional ArsR family regulator
MNQISRHSSARNSSDQRRASARPSLPDDVIEVTATRLRVIADATRIRLMEMLDEGAGSVGGLAAGLGMTRQGVSWHLNVLHHAGIVSRRKDGAWVQYELADWTGWWLVEQVAAGAASDLRERRPSFAQGPARLDRS